MIFACSRPKRFWFASFSLFRLKWVESFKIVDENEECDARHLEIVCTFGEVPRNADIVKFFGEDILPFITYQKGKPFLLLYKSNDLDLSSRVNYLILCCSAWLNGGRAEKIAWPPVRIEPRAFMICLLAWPVRSHILILFVFFVLKSELSLLLPGSKREWFETKIFNENWDMKEEYEDNLMR